MEPHQVLDSSAFRSAFPALRELILAEWPQVPVEELDSSGGDADTVVALVASRTRHTKAHVRRQLEELRAVAASDRTAPTRVKSGTGDDLARTVLAAVGFGYLAGLFARRRRRPRR
jgi:hypothetical protein